MRHSVGLCLLVATAIHAQRAAVPWSSYGHGPQHTGLSTIGSQRLEQVKWSAPVDLVNQSGGGPLFIHYGTPIVTAANTVLIPERTNSTNTYQVEAFDNGSLLYALPTTYSPPPYEWVPVFGVTLSQGTRLYYPGPGGTVYYRDQPDSETGPSGQIAFYGNADYAANQSAFDTAVAISTPITADAGGNIYFGFDVTGSNPDNLTSGLARIGVDGTGSWISASAAAQGDNSIVEVAMNCAPAVSNDGSTLYFAVSEGPVGVGFSPGYLVSVNSTTLAPIARVRLVDPETGSAAKVPDIGSASPTVGPDNDVYYGVYESGTQDVAQNNDDRGWLLHFDQTLTISKTPGAFGWDDTASVVPASAVASYTGTSAYLLFTKYNNYLGLGPGGNGKNQIAVLDPNMTMTDPITGATVMQEVITILGQTPSPPNNTNGSVREWCINSGAIDPFTAAALANSEDGTLYRWDFASNSFTQKVPLTSGVSEAYTPTVIGADGTVYAINDAMLFAVGQASNMTIASTHTGDFAPGQTGAVYMLTATNSGSEATNGAVTVSDTLPAIFSAQSIGGQGWTCTQPAGPCARSDSLGAGKSYPALSLIVNVAGDGPSSVSNLAEVSADGAANSVNSISNDTTSIVPPAASLSISKTHSGNFTQGQMGALYAVVVSNAAGAGATSGTVTVTETVPQGMTLASMMGDGWNCQTGSVSCTRSDSLAAGVNYPGITVAVNVANNAATPLVNQVNVSYGGWTSANHTDSTIVTSPCALTQDSRAGVADVQKVINETLGALQSADDLNQDGAVNAVDVQMVINAALGLGCWL
ncbi:MAG TPA: hypothetical protein VMB03_09325 [Bryobacteraceae bacterium]|nr:hypothetical protein [Bryobacteraceae bacterium]